MRPGTRASRLAVLLLLTLVTGVAAVAYPIAARGDVWLHARWEHPLWLLALIAVPWVWWRLTLGEDRRAPRLGVGTIAPLLGAPRGPRVWLRDLPGVLRAFALALMVAAVAEPVSVLATNSREDEGIDLVVVLDLSGSMRAVMPNMPPDLLPLVRSRRSDILPTRIDTAKAVIRDFIRRRKTDRIGVIVFAKDAYVVSPPTLDHQLLDDLVSGMELGNIDESATAIGDALGAAAARLRRSDAESKAIILLTDGDNKGGRIAPEKGAELAKDVGASVYTVQVGEGPMAEVYEGTDLFGRPRYKQVELPVNPKLLAELAKATGGRSFVASDGEALRTSFHEILDDLQKTRFEAPSSHVEELYRLLLLPGVLLLALEALLRALVLRRFP